MPPPPSRSTRRAPLASATPATLSPEEHALLVASPTQPLHAARNSTKARVSLVEWPPHSGTRVVVKDGSNLPRWFRASIWRVQQAREWKALCFLNGMQGVPRPQFRDGPAAFGMEWTPGEPLLRFAPGELPVRAVELLEELVQELQRRGVTHGDLHRDNILYDPQTEGVWLIDWATSCVFGPNKRGFKAWMWREWCALDKRALAKIKARYTPDLLTDEDRDLLHSGGTLLSRVVRRVGSFFKRSKRGRKSHPSVPSSQASA